jgi:hypothetical protein
MSYRIPLRPRKLRILSGGFQIIAPRSRPVHVHQNIVHGQPSYTYSFSSEMHISISFFPSLLYLFFTVARAMCNNMQSLTKKNFCQHSLRMKEVPKRNQEENRIRAGIDHLHAEQRK